ncbi:hypothetical protein GUJ93_ZPchr0002g26553 [Zizania palustris]|uniref:Glutaredoxin domain-containing protein n=1 Tax=Zizania palustris TaxID=103762 RepID=A0A8J5VVD4_ZIZPA|nr:hypothetical protein GUJ93_ZPchr0002g26553 [Zizania palustris]
MVVAHADRRMVAVRGHVGGRAGIGRGGRGFRWRRLAGVAEVSQRSVDSGGTRRSSDGGGAWAWRRSRGDRARGVGFPVEAARERGGGLAAIGGWWWRAGVAEVARGDWAMGAESLVEAIRGRATEVTRLLRQDRGIAGGSGWELIREGNRPKSHIIRLMEGFEIVMFRSKFSKWPEKVDAIVSDESRGKVAALLKRQGFNVKSLTKSAAVKEEPQPQIDYTGNLQVSRYSSSPAHRCCKKRCIHSMGCAASSALDDQDDHANNGRRRISHIVSLTSSTYGILDKIGSSSPINHPPISHPPTPPPPPPPAPEVINSWELMAGLLDPVTPAAKGRRMLDLDSAGAVLYTTTLRGVRATFEACNVVRAALESHGVAFRERDISMDRGFREELRHRVSSDGQSCPLVPCLFVRGHHVGGEAEVARLEEEGKLAALLEGLPRARPGGSCCDGCGGMRFLPCFDCSGSRKLCFSRLPVARRGKGAAALVVVRCGECNENGLVLCPICS